MWKPTPLQMFVFASAFCAFAYGMGWVGQIGCQPKGSINASPMWCSK